MDLRTAYEKAWLHIFWDVYSFLTISLDFDYQLSNYLCCFQPTLTFVKTIDEKDRLFTKTTKPDKKQKNKK